ncbi:peptidoglycan bridge formation glycyltransferase FemA/FemB family protein [Microcoleus sp. FACHB-68]|uniref:lipid II:glycine glycyltransferase FemX n=1 Tax=Microcoleus sp. FACHB-68 TaxID=2692826 RepID=UPI0016829D4D|nr:peptidoglycan bridge formation glycyltransferase FemA/FemB family protein [Microcoleus sp. FACHB-68]MBD1937229.1 peptidoglycan bridge formation glycyltransferase FemA/FemB family protein [Microcoleus sp. FACHB-68]
MMNELTGSPEQNLIVKKKISLRIRQLNLAERDLWDSLVKALPAGCFMQSWAWADFKELEGYKTFRYGLFLDKSLVGGCIFYYYPHSSQANLLIAAGGPILPPAYADEGIQLLKETAANLAKEVGAIALRIEPIWTEKPACFEGFVRAPADLLPSETLLIDLRPNEAEILAAMKPKGRYNLRLSNRHGVATEFTTNSQAIPLFYDIFWETVQRQQFFGEPYGFFINLCQSLFAANMAEIGLATWRGKVLAAILVVYWGNRATYLYGGRSFEHRQMMATYALHWAAMQQAKARGCTVYDFYGFSREPNHAYANFSKFKSQFGGVPVTTIGAHDYFFYERLADTLISLLRNLEGDSK